MDQVLLLNKLAISRWAIEYLNAAQSGGVSAFPGDTEREPRQLSKTERALYESSLEMLNRFVAGEFDFDEQKLPEPPPFPPMPSFLHGIMATGNNPPPAGQPAEGQGP